MLATPHVMTGLVVGTISPNPLVAFVGGVVSHLVTDAMPHLDQRSFREASESNKITKSDVIISSIDCLIAGLILYYVIKHGASPTVWMGAVGGVFPDLAEAPFFLFYRERYRWFHHLSTLHNKTHFDQTKFKQNRAWVYAGVLSQIVVMAGTYAYLRYLPEIWA